MATTFVIACPDCGKQVKVSDEHVGKKVKCKGCGSVYPVKAPGQPARKGPPPAPGKGKAKPTQAKATKAKPPEPEPEEEEVKEEAHTGYTFASQYEEEDEDAGPKQYTLAKTDDHLPRCPFCAKELESHDALICLHCGYNTRTRTRPEVQQVYQNSFARTFFWLLPGILCVLVVIGFVVFNIIFWIKIEKWMEDSWFEDNKGPPPEYIAGLGPGFCKLYVALITLAIFVPLTRFAWKRLVKNPKPREERIKDEWGM